MHQKIIADIKAGNYAPIYFLHGEESFFIDEIVKVAEKEILSESEKAFNQIIMYGKDVDFKQVVDTARQFPMMAERRLVIVKEAQNLRTLTQLESYIKTPSPQTILVLAHKHKKLDGRTSFAKAIKKNAVVWESKKVYVKSRKYNISAQATAILAEYVGADLGKLSNELEKLMVKEKADKDISYDDVIERVGISREYNVFELRKAMSQKNYTKCLSIARYFGDNPKANPIQMVIPSIYGFFSQLFVAKMNSGLPDQQLARAIGVNPYFVKEYKEAARIYSLPEIKKSFSTIKRADLHAKGIGARRAASKDILQDLIFDLAYAK
jgi:DNA polymerase-3 subunit delta